MDGTEQAAVEAARARARRIVGLLGELVRELTALSGDEVPMSVTRAHDARSQLAAVGLIDVGRARYGAVDVVVIPRRQRRRSPTTTPDGVKENGNGTQDHEGAQPRVASRGRV